MSSDSVLAEYELGGGARLTLYQNRLVQQGSDAMESVPLAKLASVRVAFERDLAKPVWATALLLAAFVLMLIAGPLQRWTAAVAAKFGVSERAESLDGLLHAVFDALGGLASLLPAIAAALVAGAAALLLLFWLGRTTLTLAFAATERIWVTRGRDRRLVEFAELVCDRLAERKD